MNALGWQIGAILFGVSTLLIAIYISKILNESTKVIGKVYKIVDYNERHIHETIDNVASITKDVKEITNIVSKLASVAKIFKILKK